MYYTNYLLAYNLFSVDIFIYDIIGDITTQKYYFPK